MIETLNALIAALRDELQQYGEMLTLLDREQELVVQRASQDLFEAVNAIQNQAGVIQRARNFREVRRQEVAIAAGLPADTSFTALLPQLPADYQPLVQALVRENNQLLVRVQQRARQNHLLLSRSLELMQRFMSMLFPSRDSQVYDDHGQRPSWAPPLHSLYEAVG